MKVEITVDEILNSVDSKEIVESLLNFFKKSVSEVYSYRDLSDKIKIVFSEETFNFLTKKEELRKRIIMLFDNYVPEDINAPLTNKDKEVIISYLCLGEYNEVKPLLNLREDVIKYAHQLITSGAYLERSEMSIMNKMSNILQVIDDRVIML